MLGMKNNNIWISSIIPLSKEKFIEVSRSLKDDESLKGKVVAKYYIGDEDEKDFPVTLAKYSQLIEKRKKSKD